ncbi:MAG: hypothetical protein WA173_14225 [Pseudomonas sp.]|uniref:hypothetical protein n=1 Tax=Pseudomonas sp. TaxID=306 RepID=UPI003BB7F6F5
MSDTQIAKLVASLGFQIDNKQLLKFQRDLTETTQKLKALGAAANKSMNMAAVNSGLVKTNSLTNKGLQLEAKHLKNLTLGRKLSAEGFKAKLQASKLQLQQDSAAATTAQRFAAHQQAQTLGQMRLDAQASNQNIRMAKARMQLQAQAARIQRSDAAHAIRQANIAAKAKVNHLRASSGSGGGFSGLGRGLGQAAASGGGAGGVMGALSAAGPLGVAFAALTAAATAAGVAIQQWGDSVLAKGEGRQASSAKFGALSKTDTNVGKGAESRYRTNAQLRGDDADAGANKYAGALVGATKAGFSLTDGESLLNNVLDTAKASSMDEAAFAGMMQGIQQTMNSGQLTGENENQIADNLTGGMSELIAAYNKSAGGKALVTEKDREAAGTKYFKDRDAGNIKGASMRNTLKVMFENMATEAKRNGTLDLARNNQASATNRMTNLRNDQQATIALQNDGEVGKAQSKLNAASLKALTALEPFLKDMGTLAAMLDTLSAEGLEEFSVKFGAWYADFKTSLSGVLSLFDNLDPASVESFKVLANTAISVIGSVLSVLGVVFTKTIEGWKLIFNSDFGKGVMDALTTVGEGIKLAMQLLEAIITGNGAGISTAFDALGKHIGDSISKFFDSIQKYLPDFLKSKTPIENGTTEPGAGVTSLPVDPVTGQPIQPATTLGKLKAAYTNQPTTGVLPTNGVLQRVAEESKATNASRLTALTANQQSIRAANNATPTPATNVDDPNKAPAAIVPTPVIRTATPATTTPVAPSKVVGNTFHVANINLTGVQSPAAFAEQMQNYMLPAYPAEN